MDVIRHQFFGGDGHMIHVTGCHSSDFKAGANGVSRKTTYTLDTLQTFFTDRNEESAVLNQTGRCIM